MKFLNKVIARQVTPELADRIDQMTWRAASFIGSQANKAEQAKVPVADFLKNPSKYEVYDKPIYRFLIERSGTNKPSNEDVKKMQHLSHEAITHANKIIQSDESMGWTGFAFGESNQTALRSATRLH